MRFLILILYKINSHEKVCNLSDFVYCNGFAITCPGTKKDKPDEQITVNKKYDENGNLVQYDSTYVHQWSSDSTLNFSFDHHFNFGDDFPDALDNSSIDSMLQQLGIAHNFNFAPFDDEDFLGQFGETFPDSLMNNFHFYKDSVFQYHLDPQAQMKDLYSSPDFDKLQKQLQEQLEQFNQVNPQFQNEEQRKEWEELMEKQQKEKEKLLNKWNGDKKL